jgi:hypothetical protein
MEWIMPPGNKSMKIHATFYLSFKDNIAAWNRDHPDDMFSLIEITPSAYPY